MRILGGVLIALTAVVWAAPHLESTVGDRVSEMATSVSESVAGPQRAYLEAQERALLLSTGDEEASEISLLDPLTGRISPLTP